MLAGDPDGLRLTGVYSYQSGPDHTLATLDYFYQGASALGDLNCPSFNVQIAHWTAPADDPTAGYGTPVGTQQASTLTVAGQTVPALYIEDVANEGQIRHLIYGQGTTQVRLTGAGLSKEAFFAAVSALVDGKANPDVVAHLQRELDAAAASATGTP